MIELARPQDRAAVSRLARQIHGMHVAWRPDIYEMVEERFPQEYFDRAVQRRELYVAVLEQQVVGYVLLSFRNAAWPGVVSRRIMCIDEFCVEESLRRHGIGTQMLSEIKVLAKAFGCTDLQLSVYPQNDDAVGFYQKNGFMIQDIKMQMKL